MTALNNTQCCGMGEITGITNTEDPVVMLQGIGASQKTRKRSFLLFSCPAKRPQGDVLAGYIKENGLGEVFKSGTKKNPNSGNDLNIFLWEVELAKFNAWTVKHEPFAYQAGDRVTILKVASKGNSHLVGYTGTVYTTSREQVFVYTERGKEIIGSDRYSPYIAKISIKDVEYIKPV